MQRHDLRQLPSRVRPAEEALNLWRSRSRFRATLIAPPAEPAARETERQATLFVIATAAVGASASLVAALFLSNGLFL